VTNHLNDCTIARATLADLADLADMFESYRAFYECPPRTAESRAFLERRLGRGDSTILIARRDDRLTVGFVQLYPCFSSLAVSSIWVVNDLYVKPEYRTAGIGRALMHAARRFGEETGAARLLLETASDNIAARRLYESLGYTLDQPMLHYSLELAKPDSTAKP
jgi:ribosomal protein S18 acetylase RimI-like enzyme